MTGGVGVGELHARSGEAVNVRRLIELAAETADICPPEVVDQEEDDVWEPRLSVGQVCMQEQEEELRESRHNTQCLASLLLRPTVQRQAPSIKQNTNQHSRPSSRFRLSGVRILFPMNCGQTRSQIEILFGFGGQPLRINPSGDYTLASIDHSQHSERPFSGEIAFGFFCDTLAALAASCGRA